MQAVKRISAKWKNGTSQNISTKLHTHGWFGKSSTLRLKDLHIGVLVEELCGASLPGFLGGSGVSRDHDDRNVGFAVSQLTDELRAIHSPKPWSVMRISVPVSRM